MIYKGEMAALAPAPQGNITFVSMLVRNPADPNPPIKRIEWLLTLLQAQLPLLLYVDLYYAEILGRQPPPLKILPLDVSGTEMAQHIAAHTQLHLPAERTAEKDTVPFMTLMYLKTELVARAARDGLVTTPFVAFLDASIAKVLHTPKETLAALKATEISPAAVTTPLLPGCLSPHIPMTVSEKSWWARIIWVFCGGFFLLPTTRAMEWHVMCREQLLAWLRVGRITWEVNLWGYLAQRYPNYLIWWQADHNDSMLRVPPPFLASPKIDPDGPAD